MQYLNKNNCPITLLNVTQTALTTTYKECLEMCAQYFKTNVLTNGNMLKQDFYFETLIWLLEHKRQLELLYDVSFREAVSIALKIEASNKKQG